MNKFRPSAARDEQATSPQLSFSRRRVRMGLTLTLFGFLVFLLGARPSVFGLDRSPIIGFVQIAVFLVGLAIVCIGGYLSLLALWKDRRPTIAAEIGMRMVTTGYVISVFTGMADIFGFGSHPLPGVPYFGGLQAGGVMFGQAAIIIGLTLMIPFQPGNDRAETPKNLKAMK